jgi:ABC-type uncharacterized transport system involved in gliding motility auxiliary subunit
LLQELISLSTASSQRTGVLTDYDLRYFRVVTPTTQCIVFADISSEINTMDHQQTNMRISGGNQDFFLNCVNWMCGQESGISIHAKSVSQEYLTISSGTASLLALVMIGVLPIGYLAIGIVIWTRRKKR